MKALFSKVYQRCVRASILPAWNILECSVRKSATLTKRHFGCGKSRNVIYIIMVKGSRV